MISTHKNFQVLASIEQAAISHRDCVAIEDGSRKLSYHQLHLCLNRLASQLADNEDMSLIAVCGRPSMEAAIAILAVLASGNVVVPIDERLPKLRKMELISWCDTLHNMNEVTCLIASLSEIEADFEVVGRLERRADWQPAYITFTSGTTAQPKAIEGSIAGLNHFISWQSTLVSGWIETPRVSWLTPLSFDVMFRDLLLPLSNFGTLVIPESRSEFNIASAWNWLALSKVNIAHVVPSIVGAWLSGSCAPENSLKAVFFAGEPLKVTLIEELRNIYTGRIYNLYGPSESTMAKFYRLIDESCQTNGALYPVGVPLDESVSYRLTDKREIVIQSPYIFNCYRQKSGEGGKNMNLPPGWREYSTGDYGVVVSGDLFILGRIDNQMKVNGIRVEPAEIEALAEQSGGVNRAIAVKLSPPDVVNELVALFFQGEPSCTEDIRRRLSAKLHPAIIPKIIIHRGNIPFTINGKVDLPCLVEIAVEYLDGEKAQNGIIEASEVERFVVKIMSSHLQTQITLDAGFINAGGNSLMSGLIALELEAEFSVSVPQEIFYKGGTPRNIARWLQDNIKGEIRKHIILAKPQRLHENHKLPLSIQQQTIYNIFCKDLYGSGVNMVLQIPFTSDKASKIKTAICRIVSRNDCFHLRFETINGQLFQRFERPENFEEDIEIIEASEDRHDEIVADIAARTFTLESERPFRIKILQKDECTGLLVLCMHHLISDGMSREFIRRDVLGILNKETPRLRGQFSQLLASQSADIREKTTRYWFEKMQNCPPMTRFIRGDKVRDLSTRSMTVRLMCPHNALLAVLSELNMSLFPYLMAHFCTALSRYSDLAEHIIRVTTHGRCKPEHSDTLGCVFSAVPIRVACNGDGPREIANILKKELEQARLYQDLMFEELAQLIGEPRSDYLHPVTGVTFAMEGYDMAETLPVELNNGPITEPILAKLPHELLVFVRPYRDGCAFRFIYRTNAFSDEDISTLWMNVQDSIQRDLGLNVSKHFH